MRSIVIPTTLLALACAPAPKDASPDAGSEHRAPTDSGAACDPLRDTDADGLDDCGELEHGTDPTRADTDADGLSDAEEVACVSDPLDASEVCYTCGWPHRDPGTLTGEGSTVGSTVANLELIDQCGERVQLWDLAGEWHVVFMTASWCGSCLDEARRFDAEQAAFVADTGVPLSFLTVLFQDSTGGLPGPDEGARYADRAAIEHQPVLADPIAAILGATPYDGSVLPGVCALSPEMVLVDCAEGAGAVSSMLAVVEASAD